MKKSLYKSVLICRFSALGDVAMTIPVVYSICEANPDKDFYFLTKKFPSHLFLNAPTNLKVIGIETSNYKGILGLYNLANEIIEKYGVEAYADLHGSLRSRILGLWLGLNGVKVASIRKGKRGKRALTRKRNKVMVPLVSTRARYREVFFRLGLPYKETFKGLFKGNNIIYTAQQLIEKNKERLGMESIPLNAIGIAPFAAHRGKVYPEELMEQVIKNINETKQRPIFIFGAGQEESDIIARWAMKYENVINMAALKIGIEGEIAIMSKLKALISMDSANMHFASLVGTRVISIWGATHPFCGFMGWKQSKQDSIQLDMVCRPCSVFGNKPCHRGDFHCMYGIAPERILNALN